MGRQRGAQRVILAGAGPIGAVLAFALRRRDIPVVLIEALATPEIDCRAASCHPPTVAMLDELGLLEDGLEQGLVSPVFNYIDRVTGELVGRFDFFGVRPELGNRNYFSDPDEWMNLFKARGPEGEGMWRSVSPTRPEQTDEELLSPAAVEARLQKFCRKAGRYEIATIALYKVHQRVAATFNRGRVLLAGDSAHVNNPVGGMGMNGGIHDAVNLADKMRAAWFEGADDPALFDRYTRQRRKVQVDYVQAQSIQNKQTLGEKDPVERARKLDHIRRQSSDPELHDAFIRRACLIDSLQEANATA